MELENLQILRDLQTDRKNAYTWCEIAPLPNLIPKAPSMTPELAKEMIPEAVLDWILDYSYRAQVPIEASAVAALGTLASLVGRNVGIYPKINDNYWIPLTLWTAHIARPGEKKSSIISFAQKPLDKLEQTASAEYKASLSKSLAEKEVQRQKIEAIKERMKASTKSKGKDSIEFLQVELSDLLSEEKEEPQEKRYRTNDSTVEKLGELLRGNPRGLLVVRDELIGWLKGFEKPGRESDRAFFLEGWDASGAPFSVDRIGRKRVVVESLCLHVMGGIQPGRLEEYINQAVNGGSGDDGFLQRFQLMVFPEPPKTVQWVDEKPNFEAIERAQRIFEWLDQLQVPHEPGKRPGVRFCSEAQPIYQEWAIELETRFRLGDDEHPAFVSHLSKYLRLMPALALLFHLVECADNESLTLEISKKHAGMAAAWCDFLEQHARKVYAIVERKEIRNAEAIRKRIRRGDIVDGVSLSSVAHRCWSPFGNDPEAIRQAITTVLEPYGYCRLETSKHGMGRPSEIIRINPSFKGGANA